MIIGIETTAHTFGVAVVDHGKILCNVRDSYTTEKGGIIAMDAAKHHRNVSETIFKKALEEAKIAEKEIKAIAISNAPGLAPCLSEGMKFAKKKAAELGLLLIPVNHCAAHLEIGRITGSKDPVLLYASGANTQIIAYADGKYRVFGETLDIGIGNFLDNFARYLGLGFPGGPKIMELGSKGKKYDALQKKSVDYTKEDLAYSVQETAFALLVEASERAMAHIGKKELLLGGGVGCNARLQEMCKKMCEARGAAFFAPGNSLLIDNGAMIAYLGEIMFNHKIFFPADEVDINPRERTDDVQVTWR